MDIVRDLLVNKRYRVEVWGVPSGVGKRDQNNWKITKRASPGNVHDFEDLVFQEDTATGSDNPITIALQFSHRDGMRLTRKRYPQPETMNNPICRSQDRWGILR